MLTGRYRSHTLRIALGTFFSKHMRDFRVSFIFNLSFSSAWHLSVSFFRSFLFSFFFSFSPFDVYKDVKKNTDTDTPFLIRFIGTAAGLVIPTVGEAILCIQVLQSAKCWSTGHHDQAVVEVFINRSIQIVVVVEHHLGQTFEWNKSPETRTSQKLRNRNTRASVEQLAAPGSRCLLRAPAPIQSSPASDQSWSLGCADKKASDNTPSSIFLCLFFFLL